MRPLCALAAMALVLSLAACGKDGPAKADAVYSDPKMDAVLFDPLLTDTDLSQQNRRNAAVEPGGPADSARPGPYPEEKPPVSRR